MFLKKSRSKKAQHALEYALQGITSIEEVIRVAGSIDDSINDFADNDIPGDAQELPN